jgi:proteasome lid subunit RPN8/RPN11
MAKRKPDQRQPRVTIEGEVLRQIRQHARSNSKTEVCGVLIGEENGDGMNITARIPGLNAAQAGTYVTFTQDTWEHIYKIKDKDFPDERIVGWYHSHPGFGVFLSDHDTFIHKNFFSASLQVAWVYDPHSDEEGCFGWAGERIERLSEIHVKDDKGGEEAGETGKPEPVGSLEEDDDPADSSESSELAPPSWLRWTLSIISHVLLLAVGFGVAWLLFPRQEIFFVNPFDKTVIQAPPGSRVNSDGTITLPELPDRQAVPNDRTPRKPAPDVNSPQPQTSPDPAPPNNPNSSPNPQQKPAPKKESGKDPNAPRK